MDTTRESRHVHPLEAVHGGCVADDHHHRRASDNQPFALQHIIDSTAGCLTTLFAL
jgi:hypothetical protein